MSNPIIVTQKKLFFMFFVVYKKNSSVLIIQIQSVKRNPVKRHWRNRTNTIWKEIKASSKKQRCIKPANKIAHTLVSLRLRRCQDIRAKLPIKRDMETKYSGVISLLSVGKVAVVNILTMKKDKTQEVLASELTRYFV